MIAELAHAGVWEVHYYVAKDVLGPAASVLGPRAAVLQHQGDPGPAMDQGSSGQPLTTAIVERLNTRAFAPLFSRQAYWPAPAARELRVDLGAVVVAGELGDRGEESPARSQPAEFVSS